MNTYAEKKKSPMLTKKQQSPQKSSDEMLRSGLSSLHSRPAALSEELGNKIRERCGINPASVKVYRDDGLSGLGQKAYAKGAEIHLSGGVAPPARMVSGSYFTKRRTSRSREAAASPERSTTTLRLSSRPTV